MGPKYRMMPDKGTAINAVALAAVVVLFALVILQGITIVKMKQYNDDSQRFTEYWIHKTDSLLDENFKLYMQIYELKDSITINGEVYSTSDIFPQPSALSPRRTAQ